jgi:hypothetical protein
MRHPTLTLALCLLAAPALAADATVTPGNTLTAPPGEWLGEVPHLVVMGTIGGRTFDLQMTDMAKAEGVADFAGKREYLPGEGGAWRYGDFEVALKATIDGVEKSLEFEFENHDFTAHALPATFSLQDKEFPEGLLSYFEAQTEWETPEATVNDEIGGWTGSLVLALDSGTKDDKGLVPDGMIGGFVTATREGDTLVMSFTVPVAEYELDD